MRLGSGVRCWRRAGGFTTRFVRVYGTMNAGVVVRFGNVDVGIVQTRYLRTPEDAVDAGIERYRPLVTLLIGP